jgi:hypothetical protein
MKPPPGLGIREEGKGAMAPHAVDYGEDGFSAKQIESEGN